MGIFNIQTIEILIRHWFCVYFVDSDIPSGVYFVDSDRPGEKIVETLKLARRTIFNTIKAHRATYKFTIIKMCCLPNTLNT